MDGQRSRGHAVLIVALLVTAAVLGLCAIFVDGGLWLLILAGLAVFAALVVERALVLPDAPTDRFDRAGRAERAEEPLVFLAVVLLVAVAVYVVIHLALSPGGDAGPRSPAVAGPAPEASSSKSGARPNAPTTATIATTPAAGEATTRYRTAGADVRVRAVTSTEGAIVTTIAAFASPISLSCYQVGEPVFSDPYWYRATYAGLTGYVSELWLDAGADPTATGLPRC